MLVQVMNVKPFLLFLTFPSVRPMLQTMPKPPQPETPVDMSVRLPASLAQRVFAHGVRIRVSNRSALLQAIIAEGLDAIEAKLPKDKRASAA